MKSISNQILSAIKITQWLPHWDTFRYDKAQLRSKPPQFFYLFSIKASDLRALSGVHRRRRDKPGFDSGIQRGHEEKRSDEISRFIHDGFPFSSLTDAQRESGRFDHFRQPGWLATSIVVNILGKNDRRRELGVANRDLVTVRSTSSLNQIILPTAFSGSGWEPAELPPIEVIDGQHRLFAFSEDTDFDLPVVAFQGLDLGWQAYLFWTINIKPKKINASLAFDLYPLLRTQEWLDQGDDFGIYRQTRAQELVEALWSVPISPWYQRINMLGDRGRSYVSQAAWIRSLTAALIKRSEGRGITVGGLFSGSAAADPLEWNRQQQSAFLIYFWLKLKEAIKASKASWAQALRRSDEGTEDAAFFGQHSLINQDQGVRALLHILNDVCVLSRESSDFDDWEVEEGFDDALDVEAITRDIRQIRKFDFASIVDQLCEALAKYDWRSSNAPDLTAAAVLRRKTYRGSGGYRELRIDLLGELANAKSLRPAARAALAGLRTSGR